MRLAAAILLLFAAVAAPAQQAPPPAGTGDQKELSDLLNIIEQETDVATKTRVNSDYVPGIVTVLEGSQLEALGVQNAWEALGLVPGMQPVSDPSGSPNLIVRGIDFPFNNGNVQILVNGVPLMRADAGINSASLMIPVEQIERLEVIRGPGSVIYGDFAFMGLVNIVTRKTGQRAYVRGDNRARSGGGYGSWQSAQSSVSANVSRMESDNAPVSVSRAHDARTFGIVNYTNRGFSLSAETANRIFRPSAGTISHDEKSWTADAKYDREIVPKVRWTTDLSYLDSDFSGGVSSLTGHLTKVGTTLLIDRWKRQSWLAGADYSVSTIDTASHLVPAVPGGPPVVQSAVASDVERRITGVTLQDRIDLRDDVSVTIGARRDRYSDLASRTTPRLSVVWRATEKHIVKAQYAEGFRPPTFFELYQPPPRGLVPRYPFETNATMELNYIFHTAATVARATLFRSTIRDMIRPGGVVTPGFARATGGELELSRELTRRLKIDANASSVSARDPRAAGGVNLLAPHWLANLAVNYEPLRDTFLGARWNHVGQRDAADGYDLLDLSVSRQNFLASGLSLRAGVKDAFNDRPTFILTRPTGAIEYSVFPGRSVWLQVSWSR